MAKNVLVTGVSTGLGKVLTTKLLSEGHRVWGVARKKNHHPSIQELLLNKNFTYSQCDIAKEEEVTSLIKKIEEADFNQDHVILNAALRQDDIIDNQFSYTTFKEIFNVNLFGTINLINKILPFFHDKGEGVFIGISSLAAYRGVVINKIAYPASKSALNAVFEAFRLQLTNPKIRFITVNFGPLGEERGLMQISYRQAANKILAVSKKKKNVIDYPLVPSMISKALAFAPDFLISKYIIQTKIKKQGIKF